MSDFDNRLNVNEVLDFEDDALPEFDDDGPFERDGKKPWLVVALGVIAVTLVAVVLIRFMTGGAPRPAGPETVEIVIDGERISIEVPADDFVDEANRLVETPTRERPAGMPDRVVESRQPVTFDPDKPVVQRPAAAPARPAPRPAQPAAQQRPNQPAAGPARAAQPAAAPRPAPTPTGVWMAQVGSYNTRAAAETGQRQLSGRPVFQGRNFVILQAVMPDGGTVHRLRVPGFQTSHAAEAFCREVRAAGQGCFATR